MNRQDVWGHSVRIEECDGGRVCYEIAEQTEDLGEDTLVWSEDPEDAACWIEQMVEEGTQARRHGGTEGRDRGTEGQRE